MAVALYEFPLCEKVRNYLRLEQLFVQLKQARHAESEHQYLHFFELYFNLAEMIERIDLRTEFLRDLDACEKQLMQWSQHPDIDSQALEQTLNDMRETSKQLKREKKLGGALREDRLLCSIRQRFSSPGTVASFDLPSLFCWFTLSQETKQQQINQFIDYFSLVETCLNKLLGFLRQKGQFQSIDCTNGFYQGIAEDKLDLVRIECESNTGMFPMVSGNRSRYGIKFMKLDASNGTGQATTETVVFRLACC